MIKEIRIAIQADDKGLFFEAIEKIKQDLKDGKGSVPIFSSSSKRYKYRFVIIEDASKSTSIAEDNLLNKGE